MTIRVLRPEQEADTPINKLLAYFENDAKSSGSKGWYSAHCPSHQDKAKSLSFTENSHGYVTLVCHAGCPRDQILQAMGWAEEDVTPSDALRRSAPHKPQPTLDIVTLAADKLLPWQHLLNLGLTDEFNYNSKFVVRVPYYDARGKEYGKVRVRIGVRGKDGRWAGDDSSLIPYGLHKLDMARKDGYLVIGEGESDAWTCWLHDVPYLGIPGAGNAACLAYANLDGIKQIFVIREPAEIGKQDAGKKFSTDVLDHLKKIRYKGKVYILPFKEVLGEKDPNELHKRLVKEQKASTFKTVLHQALSQFAKITAPIEKKQLALRLCDLQQEDIPPAKWAIPDILPEGATLLVGKPKLGKSWLLLAMLLAVSSGGVVLGNVPVEQGEVLYISLEDNKRRLKNRSNIVLQKAKASPDFYYATEWPRMGEGGLEELEEWIKEHPRTRLIGIDTWGRFKPQARGGNRNLYDEDYEMLAPITQLAGKYSVSIVLVHHFRKTESEDPIDGISGSTAMSGAVDNFLLLYRKRGEMDARLAVTGRDIEEEQELLLTFNKDCASWVIRGDAEEYAGTPERQAILDVLKMHPEGLPVKEIAAKLQKNVNTTRNLIVPLRNEGKIILQNNVYCLVTHSKPSNSSKSSQHSKAQEDDSALTREDTTYYGKSDTIVTSDQPVKPDKPSTYYADYGYYAKEQKNERGLRKFCNCGQNATIYTSDNAYCETCWSKKEEI